MVRQQGDITEVNITSPQAPGGLGLCALLKSQHLLFVAEEEVLHICRTTQKIFIKCRYLGTSERS